MLTRKIVLSDFENVFPVPPLARSKDISRSISAAENKEIIDRIESAGARVLIYGGNAVFYHITLKEYETALSMLSELAGEDTWVIPSVGPSFGLAMDQAEILKDTNYPVAMYLPANDPKVPEGLYRGISEFVQKSGKQVIVYIKAETNFTIEYVAKLFENGSVVGTKYAIVRDDPSKDEYLKRLLDSVDRRSVISGIGERPACVHMLQFRLPGYTTGSGCLAPKATLKMFHQLQAGNYEEAELIRERFLPFEDLRDQWNPIRVLHEAYRLTGLANTGPIPPLLSNISYEQANTVEPVAKALLDYEDSI